MSKRLRQHSKRRENKKLTLLGIFIGLLLAVGIGIVLYSLNRDHRFD